MYLLGRGVPVDYEAARMWWMKAAEQGCAASQCNLGRMYRWGYGVPVSYDDAYSWYAKAAENGDESAKEILEELRQKFFDL